ncbi:MAG: HAMP domain-containing sensor histidine kinase [Candidatus Microbacterium phytovorans]|uniref:histidine kinase n=1 Tax=Candidatus Microbacterium phytovorans TaxID=3121374 RepID=A0AAJ5W2Q9_9MICO|nr:HAMP domain-containing sensor histidine kinase [Microbacterium sp.]WEK14739.1 MAG: HAMP domain-containing sensor histidine kinase [Microbacterium sp.]
MNRATSVHSRRTRTLGLLVAVVAAGFALAALGVVLVHVVTAQPLPWAAIPVYATVSVATLVVIGIVGWTILPTVPAEHLSSDRDETAYEAQRRLLDDVRHELKTPITIVRGHLEVMDPNDPTDAAAIRDLGMAELDRMTRLIGDIDLLAAVETDKFTMSEVDLAQLTQRVGELVTVIPDHAWSVEQSADAVIRGDGDRLLQAWLQLADNAAKYTPAGSAIEVGSAVHAGGVQLWVRDHGPGIPPALRHRIFRRFDRGTGKRSVGGSGLGLAIVDAIAKAHRGHCAIADTPGGGATFTLEIPVGTKAAVPSPVRAGDVLMQREATG